MKGSSSGKAADLDFFFYYCRRLQRQAGLGGSERE